MTAPKEPTNSREVIPAMIRRLGWSTAATVCVAATMTFSSAAVADSYLAPPPDRLIVAPGGVDMRSGRYNYNHTDLSIGGEGGLELTRTMRQQEPVHADAFGYFSHNFDIRAVSTTVDCQKGDFKPNSGPDVQVQILAGGISATFRPCDQSSGNLALASSGGFGTLTYVGDKGPTTVYTYQSGDGTMITFRSIGSADCPGTMCAYASQLIRADGTVLSFGYDTAPGGGTRLRLVTSTRGQSLIFEYSGMYVTKACFLNLAFTAISTTCPAGTPTATYAYNTLAGEQRLSQVTDPTGAIWKFVNEAGPSGTTKIGFINPGESSPWLTNTMGSYTDDNGAWDIVWSQSFADGQSYGYTYDYAPADQNPGAGGGHIPQLAGGSYVDADGRETDVTFSFPAVPSTAPGGQCTHLPCVQPSPGTIVYQQSAGPVTIRDPLGNETHVSYSDPNAFRYLLPLEQSVTDPDGYKTVLTWQIATHNLIESDAVSKTGGASLSRFASYDCGPSNWRFCNKPITLTDAKGNVTNYGYKPENGGVIYEIKPAPSAGAPRPLKLTGWIQKYAYVLNGGSLVPAASPVWLISSETECQLAAGGDPSNPVCDTSAGAPKRVTSYEYGPGPTANNLFVRGVVVTADGTSRRTCYSYDNYGNRISQTSPRAGLATCP